MLYIKNINSLCSFRFLLEQMTNTQLGWVERGQNHAIRAVIPSTGLRRKDLYNNAQRAR